MTSPDPIREDASTFARDGLEFRYLQLGPPDGEPVVLLHGFPQDASAWAPVMERLASRGYRALALNQRGYSPGAAPGRLREYRLGELVSDTLAFIDTVAGTSVHLVGHDLGAVVAWNIAASFPSALRSLAAVSVPHPRALSRAFLTSGQALRSWYIPFLQLPLAPELAFRAKDGAAAVRLLERTGLPRAHAERYARRLLTEPGALAGAVSWYRAFPLSPGLCLATAAVSVPTLYLWGDRDAVVSRAGAERTGRHVTGPYDFRILERASHWIPEEAPLELADLIAAHARRHTPDLPT